MNEMRGFLDALAVDYIGNLAQRDMARHAARPHAVKRVELRDIAGGSKLLRHVMQLVRMAYPGQVHGRLVEGRKAYGIDHARLHEF